ncbi:MAG: hypothetical protein ABI977_26480 [Acidobacteriota bacterium]
MNNARIAGLGFLFAIIGFFIGRTYLPATPENTLAFSSFTARPSTVATPNTAVIPIAVATPIPVAPISSAPYTRAATTNAYPTPYPTPNDSGFVVTNQQVTRPRPRPITSSRAAEPADSDPGLYPTPYPTPSDGLVTSSAPVAATAPAPIAVNRAPEPMNLSLDGLLDRQSHLVYFVLGLLALGILYRMRSNEPAVCVAMLIVGLILGHYIDPGPINLTNPFNRTV